MLERNGVLIRKLEAALLEEIKLQVSYSMVVEEENSFITKFNTEKIQALSEKREAMYYSIAQAMEKRAALALEIPGATQSSCLRDLLKAQAHPDDAARLNRHAEKLRVLVQSNHQRGREFGRLANFALTLVNGSLSILWSATQSITRAYGRNAVVKESFAPKTRSQMTIKEA